MKLIKIFLIILAFLIISNTVSAERYINYEFREGIISNNQLIVTSNPLTYVDMMGFICGDSACSVVTGSLWNGEILSSEWSDVMGLTFPSYQPAFSWGVYYFKEGYIPWESNPTWWGTNPGDPQGPYTIVLAKKDVCSAPIDSFAVANEVQPNVPLVINVGAGLDSSTHSAIQNSGPLAYRPSELEQYYSVQTRISLVIYNSSDDIIEQQTRIVNITYSGTEPIQFNWTPVTPGTYNAVVTTEVTDSKCLSTQMHSASSVFEVLEEEPINMCYTLLNDIYISNQFPAENETIAISGYKISNYADNNSVLTPTQTNLTLYVTDQNGSLIYNSTITLPANPNTEYPGQPFDLTYTANGAGDYRVAVIGIANSSLCNGLLNLPMVMGLDMDVRQYYITNTTANQPPVITGLPDLTVNENSIIPANWIDLWVYAYDSESSDDHLQFSIVSESSPGLIDCRIDNSRYLNCDLAPDSYGFSDIAVQVDDGQYFDRDSFRITVNQISQRPSISNIPNVNFNEDSSASLNLSLYVTDPDNNVSELTWTAAGNNHIHVNINNNIATFTADRNWFGQELIVFTAADPDNNTDSDNVFVAVGEMPDAPTINLSNIYFYEDGSLTLNLNNFISDPDNKISELTWTITGNNHVQINVNGNSIIFTADPDWYGAETVLFTITDPEGNIGYKYVTVNVLGMNDAPIIIPMPSSFNLGVKKEIKINLNDYAEDIDNNDNELIWSYSAGRNLEVSIGRNNIAAIKTKTKLGTFPVTFTAEDPDGFVASFTLNINVDYAQKNSDLTFDTVRISNELVKPGEELVINVGLRNEGYKDFDKVKVSAIIYELGISKSVTGFDIDEQDMASKRLYLEIPEYAPPGIYNLRIVVSNDQFRRVVNREFIIE